MTVWLCGVLIDVWNCEILLYFAGKNDVKVVVPANPSQPDLFNIPIETLGKSEMLSFMRSQRGAPFLVQAGFIYRCERFNGQRTYWLCTKYKTVKCNGRLICQANEIVKATPHNHERDLSRMDRTVIEYHNMADPNIEEFLGSYKKQWTPHFSDTNNFLLIFFFYFKHNFQRIK